MKGPLVSCIMPTRNRRLLARQAIHYVNRQTYRPLLELVIVDGAETSGDWWNFGERCDLASHCPQVTYVHAPAANVGEARNAGVAASRGRIIVHFDDDDWYAPHYVETLVADLLRGDVDLTGTSQFWYYNFWVRRGWQSGLWNETHPAGSTFCYWRELFDSVGPYPPIPRGEDYEFFKAAQAAGATVRALQRPDLYVYMRHQVNTTGEAQGIIDPGQSELARAVIGRDLEFYDELAELVSQPDLDPRWHLPADLRGLA